MEIVKTVWLNLLALLNSIYTWYVGILTSLFGVSIVNEKVELYVVAGTVIFLAILFDFCFAGAGAWLRKDVEIRSRRIRDTFSKLVAVILPFVFLCFLSLTAAAYSSLSLLHTILDATVVFYMSVVILCELISVLETSADLGFPYASAVRKKLINYREQILNDEEGGNENE